MIKQILGLQEVFDCMAYEVYLIVLYNMLGSLKDLTWLKDLTCLIWLKWLTWLTWLTWLI